MSQPTLTERLIANLPPDVPHFDSLEALEQSKPKRGRKRTADSITKRLATIEEALADGPEAIVRLSLVQERMDLTQELEAMNDTTSIAELEKGFIEVAASYSERKGISYTAWREIGVQPSVLREAGVGR